MNWKHFSIKEFDCRCGCGGNEMDHSFIDQLDVMRSQVGFPLHVSSGYRCPEHNDKVSSTGLDGPHTTGKAVDFVAYGQRAFIIVRIGLSRFSGVGINQKGDYNKRFIHLDVLDSDDTRRRPHIWTY